MTSVIGRIKQIKQPRGGYINPKEFTITALDDGIELNPVENIHSSLVGIVVDYMTRYLNHLNNISYLYGTDLAYEKAFDGLLEAFKVSIIGALIIKDGDKARELCEGIEGLDDQSIINACKLVGYDVCFRAGVAFYKPVDTINPDKDTIANIRCMIQRSLKFIGKYGPIIKDGFNFEGGYTDLVNEGDGDFLTKDTLWDFKVSNKALTNKHTLQLLMYYLMGTHSIHEEDFLDIKNIGVFNPRLNTVYLLKISDIPKETIKAVSEQVIGY